MKVWTVVICALFLALDVFAAQEVVSIRLSDLEGTYEVTHPGPGTIREIPLVLPEGLSEIVDLSVRFVGEFEVGTLRYCDGSGEYDWGMGFKVAFPQPSRSANWATYAQAWRDGPGTYDSWGLTVYPPSGNEDATIDFLRTESTTIRIETWSEGYPFNSCPVESQKTAQITELWLRVTVEYGVAVESASWGSVRALYR